MSISIFPLSEGVFSIGFDKVFFPFDVANDKLDARSKGSILVEVQPFLVKVKEQYVLFDTGLGFKLSNGEMQLHHNIKQLGIELHEVKHVILSHLHKDHAGGIFYKNDLGVQTLSFPNATYYVSKLEFNYATEKGSPSYVLDDFDSLKNNSQLEWLDAKGLLLGCIEYETIGGHCPFHVCFKIMQDEDIIFFGGDVVPQLRQLLSRYIAKYDFDGRKSMELRQGYAEKGRNEGWQFLFYHDVKEPFAKLK
jgi:glyoxylase-like metal-dependent hydrolase (beta-lactamase superfamily II)